MRLVAAVLTLVLGIAPGAYAQRFPPTVMVRHQQWLITYFPDGDTSRRGETVCAEHGIQIQRALSLAEEQETLLHELLHAGACDVGGAPFYNSPSDFGIEHTGIENITGVVLDILQENPALLQYFAPGPVETNALKNRDTEH